MQQTITHKKVIIGFLASALLVIFGLYIISRANVLADTITLDLNTLVPSADVVKPSARFTSVQTIVGTVFSLVISIGSGIFVLLLLVGGVIYLTGAGNDEQTGKAKKMMIDAIIGLFIILASWGIGTWVLNTFQAKTTIETNGGIPSSVNNGICDENEKQAIQDYYKSTKISIDDLRKISDEEKTGACDGYISSVSRFIINSPNEINNNSNGINPTAPEGTINGNDNINPTSPDSDIAPDGTINNINPDTNADAMTGSIEIDANNNATNVGTN